MSPHLAHAQLLDSALPVGGFSHSFGVETLVTQNQLQSAAEVQQFLKAALHGSWASSDALLIKAVYEWDHEDLWELDARLDASRIAQETRDGLRKMGRQMHRLGTSIYPAMDWLPLRQAVEDKRCPGTWPLVYGWCAQSLGVDLNSAATGYLYTCVLATLNALVRLSVLGQTQAQGVLALTIPEMETAWLSVSTRDPWDFSTALPGLELAQIEHQTLERRLFMS